MDFPSLYTKLSPDSRTIRLLRLLPRYSDAPEESEIHCELQECTLSDAKGRYKALSYNWSGGETAGPRPYVYCSKTVVNVTPNVYEALHRLRGPKDPVDLWVDLLCINQTDDEERTHQVGMMRDIYTHCDEVIIWLGAGGPGNSSGLDGVKFHGDATDLPMVEEYMKALTYGKRKLSPQTKDFYGAFCLLSMLAQGLVASKIWYLRNLIYAPSAINGLNAILDRPWWKRIWVVQETVVAQNATVYCNNISMPWKAFRDAASTCLAASVTEAPDRIGASTYGPSLARLYREVNEIESARRAWNAVEPSGLLPLLRKFRRRGASDHRDKVFALLGLVNYWGQYEPMIPNYKLRTAAVYLDTTKGLIRSTKSLAVLSGTTASRSTIAKGFPSWVTDWSYDSTFYEHTRLAMHHLYKAGGEISEGIQLHGNTLLRTRGWHIDNVLMVFQMDKPGNNKEKLRAGVMSWRESMACRDDLVYCRGGTVAEAFWRTMCGNSVYSPAAETERGRFRKATAKDAFAFRAWSQPPKIDVLSHRRTSIIGGTFQGVEETLTAEQQQEQEQRNAIHQTIEYASRGRCFAVTRQGHIGTTPLATHPGDEVFALQGSTVPFILRRRVGRRACHDKPTEQLVLPTKNYVIKSGISANFVSLETQETTIFGLCNQDHNTCYEVVGDAYIHGVMDGEGILENRQGRLERREAGSVYLV